MGNPANKTVVINKTAEKDLDGDVNDKKITGIHMDMSNIVDLTNDSDDEKFEKEDIFSDDDDVSDSDSDSDLKSMKKKVAELEEESRKLDMMVKKTSEKPVKPKITKVLKKHDDTTDGGEKKKRKREKKPHSDEKKEKRVKKEKKPTKKKQKVVLSSNEPKLIEFRANGEDVKFYRKNDEAAIARRKIRNDCRRILAKYAEQGVRLPGRISFKTRTKNTEERKIVNPRPPKDKVVIATNAINSDYPT